MKVKEIKELEVEKLVEMMTEEEWDRMNKLELKDWQLLDLMKDGVKESNLEDDEEYTTISEYLEYLEEMHNSGKEDEIYLDYLSEMEENF